MATGYPPWRLSIHEALAFCERRIAAGTCEHRCPCRVLCEKNEEHVRAIAGAHKSLVSRLRAEEHVR